MNSDDDYTSDANEEPEIDDKDRYELILTKTKRFIVLDLKKIAESIQ